MSDDGSTSGTCPYCESARVARTWEAHERLFGLAGRFTYAECAHCGALRLTDPPSDPAPYYPVDRYYSLSATSRGVRQLLQRLAARHGVTGRGVAGRLADGWVTPTSAQGLHRWLARAGVSDRARILDVGCGRGTLVAALADAGFRDVTGIDPFAPVQHDGAGGVRILRETLDTHHGEYDLVMMHHVLEHLSDPRAALARAAELLTPDGHVLVRVPIVPSASWERWGTAWAQLDAPRHLTIPSERGFVACATAVGLRLVAHEHDSTPFQFWASAWIAEGRGSLEEGARRIGALARRRGRAAARRLNAAGRGDQAAFLFSR